MTKSKRPTVAAIMRGTGMLDVEKEVMVTVHCIAYNQEKYVRDALEGFIMQRTNFPFEVLMHDDASTDGTANIIREYEKKYPDIIKPIYQKENTHNKGINKTFAYMLPRTKGKYIALCEGDDYWVDPYKLQKQFAYMETHPDCSLVAHEAEVYCVAENRYGKYTDYDFEKKGYEIPPEIMIQHHSVIPTASLFFRTEFYYHNGEILKKLPGFDYVLKTLLATEGQVHVIPGVMSVYRRGSVGSWTQRVGEDDALYVEHMKRAIDALATIDEYRNYKYSEAIQNNIIARKFQIEIRHLNIDALRRPPYCELFNKMPLKSKVGVYMRKYTPLVHKILKEKILKKY